MSKKISFNIICRELKISPAKLINIQEKLNMGYYSDCTIEQVEQIKNYIKNFKKITSASIAKDYNISMPTLAQIKIKLGIPKGKGLSKRNADKLIHYLKNKPKSMNELSRIYKISNNTSIRIKKQLGYSGLTHLNIEQSKNLEKGIRDYARERDSKQDNKKKNIDNDYTTAERCAIIKNKLDAEGYIRSVEITKLFNGLHIQSSINIIEKHLGIELYDDDDTVKDLRYGIKESDDIPDELKYKNVRVYRNQTEQFRIWRTDAKVWNGHRGKIKRM